MSVCSSEGQAECGLSELPFCGVKLGSRVFNKPIGISSTCHSHYKLPIVYFLSGIHNFNKIARGVQRTKMPDPLKLSN